MPLKYLQQNDQADPRMLPFFTFLCEAALKDGPREHLIEFAPRLGLERTESARALLRLGVQIASSSGNTGVPEKAKSAC